MEYIELLLTEGHKYVVPLNTFNRVMRQLEELRGMLEKPVEHAHEGTFTPTERDTFTGVNPLYRDSVGTEELKGDDNYAK